MEDDDMGDDSSTSTWIESLTIRREQSTVPESFCFQSRIVRSHQYNASDPFLIGFVEPNPDLKRSDTYEIRKRILELAQSEARKLGICKSTLH